MDELTPDQQRRLEAALGIGPPRDLNTLKTASDTSTGSRDDPTLIEALLTARQCLHRWRTRYAQGESARQHVKETNLLIERIDELLLKR